MHLVEPGHCQPTQRGGVDSDNGNAVTYGENSDLLKPHHVFWICSAKDPYFEGQEKLQPSPGRALREDYWKFE